MGLRYVQSSSVLPRRVHTRPEEIILRLAEVACAIEGKTQADTQCAQRMWSDPDKEERRAVKAADPTAAARSAIRRRHNLHRLDPLRYPPRSHALSSLPRIQRSPPPSHGFRGSRHSRRRTDRTRVPPVSTLLESVDRQSGRPPLPSLPLSSIHLSSIPSPNNERRNSLELQVIHERERTLDDNIAALYRAAYLTRDGGPLDQDNVPFSRSPEPISEAETADPIDRRGARRGTLPTPPLDTSYADMTASQRRAAYVASVQRSDAHRRAHRRRSPVNGLGDRDRSPTPVDGWEIMRNTITPDATLPSAESSFASAAASNSFATNADAWLDEADSVENSDDEISYIDPYEDDCTEDWRMAFTATVAKEMYLIEDVTMRGRHHINFAANRARPVREGIAHRLGRETSVVEIGLVIVYNILDQHLADSIADATFISPGLSAEIYRLRDLHDEVVENRFSHGRDARIRSYRRQLQAVFCQILRDAQPPQDVPSPSSTHVVPPFNEDLLVLVTPEVALDDIVREYDLEDEPPSLALLRRAIWHIAACDGIVEKWKAEFGNGSLPIYSSSNESGRAWRRRRAQELRRAEENEPVARARARNTRAVATLDGNDRSGSRL